MEKEYFIYLKDISPHTTNENLANFIEVVVSRGKVDSDKIIFNRSRTCALITVISAKPDLNKVRSRIQTKGVDGEKPEVYEVSHPRSIALSCDEVINTTSSDFRLYIEGPRFGDADLKQDMFESEDGSCLVLKFDDPNVVKRVCERGTPYIWQGKELKVSPYFECEAGAIWDSSLHVLKTPGPVTLELRPGHLILLQRNCCIKLLESLRQNYCNPIFQERGLTLECTLTHETDGFEDLARHWEKTTRNIVDRYMEKFVEHKLQCLEQDWGELVKYLKSGSIHYKDEVAYSVDNSCFVIYLSGLKESVTDVSIKLRKQEKKIETFQSDDLRIKVLNVQGVFRDIEKEINGIKIDVNRDKVTIEGKAEDIEKVREKLFEVESKTAYKKWRHEFSRKLVELVQKKFTDKISSLLLEENIYAEWQIDNEHFEVCTFGGKEIAENCVELAEKALNAAVVEVHESLQESEMKVLRSPIWKTFLLENISKPYGNDVVIDIEEKTSKICIFGMREEANVVLETVKVFLLTEEKSNFERIFIKFIKTHRKDWIKTQKKKCEKCMVLFELGDGCIIWRGYKRGFAEAKKEFTNFSNAFHCLKYKNHSIAVKEVFKDEKECGKIDSIAQETSCLIVVPGHQDHSRMRKSKNNEDIGASKGIKAENESSKRTSVYELTKKFESYAGTARGRETSETIHITAEDKEEKKKVMQELSSLEVHIYSDSKANILNCKRRLEAALEKEYGENKIENRQESVISLNDDEMKKLDFVDQANINIDRQTGIITIYGPKKHLSDVTHKLLMALDKIERYRNITKNAKELFQKIVQWHFERVTDKQIEIVPYNAMLNQEIEHAFQANKKEFEYSDDDGDCLVIDFKNCIAHKRSNRSCLKVFRKDIKNSLPVNWTYMEDSETLKVIPLVPTDKEYQDIKNRFIKEMNAGSNLATNVVNNVRVKKIERIQNKPLFQQYQAQKKHITEQKLNLPATMQVERDLWKMSKYGAVKSIHMYGFNRSSTDAYGGDKWFAEGVSFSVNACWSARGWQPGYDSDKNGYMFLAKTLTGLTCKGQRDMKYLPPVDAKDSTILYDSAVDDLQNPRQFVIFNDTQAYPEYMITFTA